MEDAGIWTEAIKALISGGPGFVLAVVVLYINYRKDVVREGSVGEKFDKAVEKFDNRLVGIENSLKELVEVKKDVEHLTERVERVEDKCERRHTKE